MSAFGPVRHANGNTGNAPHFRYPAYAIQNKLFLITVH